MTIAAISPASAQELLAQGAVLVDIRELDEHTRENIPQAQHVPLNVLRDHGLPAARGAAVIFHCRSGNRTSVNADLLERAAGCDIYLLEGGLDGWKKAGLGVAKNAKQPLEMVRQVQIAAGALIVLGAVLGGTFSPWFFLLSGGVGAGLTFSGITGTCALARVLQRMPWNQRVSQ